MKRRSKLAATAATAAIAVASPATAAKTGHARATGGKPRVSQLAAAQSSLALQSLEAMRGAERREHRRGLATALAAELPRSEAPAVERGLAAAEVEPATLASSLAMSTGASERQVEEAFEAMARTARAKRLRG